MGFKLYSERKRAGEPRDAEEIGELTWHSIAELIDLELRNRSFAGVFPIPCSARGSLVHGINWDDFDSFIRIHVPVLGWSRPAVSLSTPDTDAVFDFLELCYSKIAKAIYMGSIYGICAYGRHLRFDEQQGKKSFRNDINRIFEREKIAFELNEEGIITRIGAPIISDAIHDATFHTGDDDLDSMLETARSKFISRDPAERNEALKDLWDAWERLKTLENPSDKKDSTAQLLDHVADGELRQSLEKETRELTDIGNKFQIRHSEVDQVPLTESHHADYFFHRMFSLVHMLLVATGRGG